MERQIVIAVGARSPLGGVGGALKGVDAMDSAGRTAKACDVPSDLMPEALDHMVFAANTGRSTCMSAGSAWRPVEPRTR